MLVKFYYFSIETQNTFNVFINSSLFLHTVGVIKRLYYESYNIL